MPMSAESTPEHRRRGRLFDLAPEVYLAARPGYPDAVFALLVRACGLRPGARVLEVGAGAGQATLPLLRLGAHVTAVEPGAALSEVLARRAAGFPLTVITAPFEEASIDEAAFDLVVSATAWHWVDPRVRVLKAAAALRTGGWLALWWTEFGDPTRPDPFRDALESLLARLAPELLNPPPAADPAREIEESSLFTGLQRQTVSWEGRHDPAQLRALFSTFSPWLALPDRRRSETLDALERLAREQFAGVVVRPYRTFVYLAERVAR
jgi:SAM-dependent methyltransferase